MIRRLFLSVALIAVLASCGDDGGGAADPVGSSEFDAVIEIEVIDGELVGGSRQVDLNIGDRVRAVLTGNTDDQIHFHGYDHHITPVDGEGELIFDAIIPGTFEVELEASSRLLLRMTVS